MKKLLAIILCCVISVSFVACSKAEKDARNPELTQSEKETTGVFSTKTKEAIENKFKSFKGIIYVTKNGELVYSQAAGKDEKGNDLTVNTPMYVGSVSKQFCATAIMMLKEQGKLSVDDTLDKYFPDYKYGKDITIKNLLTMRSGIPEMITGIIGHAPSDVESENVEFIKNWTFDQPLNFEPDTDYEYSNTNYFLLANIIEMLTAQHYNDFIRENILVPLEMNDTCFVMEVKDKPFFSDCLTYDSFLVGEGAPGVPKGAGDIVTTAPDMDKWMTALRNKKLISEESFNEMKQNYSTDVGGNYGYGLNMLYMRGAGHYGSIGSYRSVDYINEEYGYNIYAVTTESYTKLETLPEKLTEILISHE